MKTGTCGWRCTATSINMPDKMQIGTPYLNIDFAVIFLIMQNNTYKRGINNASMGVHELSNVSIILNLFFDQNMRLFDAILLIF
ncbi:hypothetical protein I6F65_14815 [Pseudoalteromonas sp. SWXJZ94C]|uniref:hypothetical protein n=1 Tax=Pseudoalteromonas sp. SWXJZ94C TaxID=2792065 RepID=UPI0018CD469C|nr:hypothetical protein [Pseudoalteromonas sp. SWXJZ94C]MBH0058231.1 hypothetical protein [Pseudoalteromonas sp. SWXJZ94C]